MPDSILARRYATALYDSAQSRGIVDAVDGDVAALAEFLSHDRDLQNFLHSPRVLPAHKIEMVRTAFGERVQGLTVSFLLLLLDKKRFDHLSEIASEFGRLADVHRGILRATVRTPTALDAEEVVQLTERLASMTGKQIKLDQEVDSAMLGGISVVVGDHLLDGSVRAGLAKLRDRLRAVSVI